jgi:acyl-homoserine-lactone acylase
MSLPRFVPSSSRAHALTRRTLLRRLAGGGLAALGTGSAVHGTPTLARPATPVVPPAAATPTGGTEILWDTWGTPHIYAEDSPGLFYAFGWAQAHNHGDLLLRLYAQARGRGAEVYGEGFLPSDRVIRTFGLHERGTVWYGEQTADFHANLDAFAAGVNAYAALHLHRLAAAAKTVLPVDATDVLAHTARILFQYLSDESGILERLLRGSEIGSNGWAIAPSHTADGRALLLVNPHSEWAGEYTFFEAQLSAPGVYDAYGATLVGIPVLAIAFNDHVGWTHTVNTIDAADVYRLTLDGNGYRFDGQRRAFETRSETINVRQDDGTLREESLIVRRSVHGPVIEAEHGQTVALRMVAIDDWSSAAGALEQWWDMGRATNLVEFEAVLRRLQVPLFTVIYADRDGHVLSLFNGQVPVRLAEGLDWFEPVPGDTSATLWTEIHPYDDLPRVLDPPGGWVQNSNSPPWYATSPLALDPGAFPSYMAPEYLSWRERRGIRMLEENPRLSLERLVELKYSTRMELADRVLDELVAAARQTGDATAREAADVLAAWDRQALATSTGTLLFVFWVQSIRRDEDLYELFRMPWDPAQALTTPSGLADPERAVRALTEAADQIQAVFGRMNVPWGEVARLRRGSVDLPANGCEGNPFGVFRVLRLEIGDVPLETTEPVAANGGDSYVAAVEFGETAQARVLLTYGNASQPGSPHVGDQLVLAANGEMRTAWRTREEIEANLEEHEVLG